jgi:RHS repeat-associated protein
VLRRTQYGATTVFVYDAMGNLAAEYGDSTTNSECITYYLTADPLGSTRLITDENGVAKARFDYLPYGQEIPTPESGGRADVAGYGQSDSIRHKFTAKERDAETGLDYFGARYDSSAQGRFLSPDPLWIKADRLIDPQRLNLYAYGRNNPIRFTNPTGMDVTLGKCPGGDARKCFYLLRRGLKLEDRNHVHYVVGDDKNGFKKGEFGVTVDKDYKSDSKNFQFLQKAANDHSAVGTIDVLSKGDALQVQVQAQLKPPKLGTMSMTGGRARQVDPRPGLWRGLLFADLQKPWRPAGGGC